MQLPKSLPVSTVSALDPLAGGDYLGTVIQQVFAFALYGWRMPLKQVAAGARLRLCEGLAAVITSWQL